MPNIERYSQAVRDAQNVPGAVFQLDNTGRQLLTRSSKNSLVGRAASWLHERVGGGQARNLAVWKNFIDAVRAHHKNNQAIAPLIRELERQSARRKPLTAMQVSTSLKNAEQLVRFANEQTIAHVLNERTETRSDGPAGAANTPQEFLHAAMDKVYLDAVARTENPDRGFYAKSFPELARNVVARVEKIKPEAGERFVTHAQVRLAVKEAAREVVGLRMVVQQQQQAIDRYSLDPKLQESAPGNRLFLEAAAEHGLKIDLTRLSPTELTDLKEEVVRHACSKAYNRLRLSRGADGEVSHADVEAAIRARLGQVFKTRYLPTIEQIKQLDIDSQSKAKLIDYISHGSVRDAGNFDVLKKIMDEKSQLNAFYKDLPRLITEVEKSRHEPVENQAAKSRLCMELLKHGKMLNAQWNEIVSDRAKSAGKTDLETGSAGDQNSFYAAVKDLSPLLFLNNNEAEQLKQSLATPAAHEVLRQMEPAEAAVKVYLGDLAAAYHNTDQMPQTQLETAREVSDALSAANVTLALGVETGAYTQSAPPPPQTPGRPASLSSLDNAVITALHESGLELPPLNRSQQSGLAVMPPGLQARLEEDMQPSRRPSENVTNLLVRDYGRAKHTLSYGGQSFDLPPPSQVKGTLEEQSEALLPAFKSFCYQHQKDAWMKKNPGMPLNEAEIAKLADSELKLISQIASQSLWGDFLILQTLGEMPFHTPVFGSQTLQAEYHVTGEADGSFRCQAIAGFGGGFLSTQKDFDTTVNPKDSDKSLNLDPETVCLKAQLNVAVSPADPAMGNESTPLLRLTEPVSYEYNFKLAPHDQAS